MNEKKKREFIYNILIFLAIMLLTFWFVFRNQDFSNILESIRKMSALYMAVAIFLALFFVAAEGCMICYLLKGIKERTSLFRCISYSFIGFFFSGITPSATGGQPMQLYCMKKDGNSLSASSVVLMTVAIIYKFVLVLIGVGILLVWREPLRGYLQGYYFLYCFGLFLNSLLVVLLVCVLFSPKLIKGILYKIEGILISLRILKQSDRRREKIDNFLSGYQETVVFLKMHKGLIGITILFTFIQRFSVFLLTYIVYRGMGLSGTSMIDIILVQASIYIAVDMLPIPGAQGITEAMYHAVFITIFSANYLTASLCITRGISFYFIMMVSLIILCIRVFLGNRVSRERKA